MNFCETLFKTRISAQRGMTLIDVLVGTALFFIIFVGLIGLLRASLLVSSSAKSKAGATAVATTQMEYIRSLPYASVGTLGGIPAGPIAQSTTTSMNGISYGVRTVIEYVDDPADGTGAADTNHVTTDYKRVKVAVTYAFRGTSREVDMISNVAPASIETTTGGGTLRVNVVSAAGSPVSGASVRIQNPSVVPAVDLTTFSDATGVVLLGGAPTSTDYRVTVSKTGYSTATTYARDATNQNPTPGYLTVATNQTTSSTFAIDVLGSLTMRTFSPIRPASSTDLFADATHLASQSSTQVSGGALMLLDGGGSGYALSGSARSTTTAPTYLSKWRIAAFSPSTPAGTGVRVHVTDSAGALIPDAILAGNSAGFATSPIDLAALSTTTYPGLGLSADLSTSATTTTSQILDWTVAFDEGPVPLPNISFTLTGAKRKGTTGSGTPIYKTVVATSTGAAASITLPLEWDVYGMTLSGYTIQNASSAPPYTLAPGDALDVPLILQ